jgi:hypothetical protein
MLAPPALAPACRSVWQGPPGGHGAVYAAQQPQHGGQQAAAGAGHGQMMEHPGLSMPGIGMGLPAMAMVGAGMLSVPKPLEGASPPPPGMPSKDSFADAAKLLGGLFDEDGEEEGRGTGAGTGAAAASVPSPPPLPEDWMDEPPPGGGPPEGAQLFDFSQFSARMPAGMGTQAGNQMYGSQKCFVGQDTREARDLKESNVVYEAQDDGDLMKLLL